MEELKNQYKQLKEELSQYMPDIRKKSKEAELEAVIQKTFRQIAIDFLENKTIPYKKR
jgi:hypothetical protein